jgi:hypothetical protein
MKIGVAGQEVFSELFVEISGFLLVSIPGYALEQDWARLTMSILLCILTIWGAMKARQKTYDKSQ